MEIIRKRGVMYGFIILITIQGVLLETPAKNCLDLVGKVRNCSSQMDIQEQCEHRDSSKVHICADAVVQKLSQCSDEVAQKIIKNLAATYKLSDEVICKNSLHSDLMNNPLCEETIKNIIEGLGSLVPGFLTEKGCKFIESILLVDAQSGYSKHCSVVNYINEMYEKSTCSNAHVENPTSDDIGNLNQVFGNVNTCWEKYGRAPNCNSAMRSELVQCIENVTVNQISSEQFKSLERNFVLIAEKTDEVICANQQLKQNFGSNQTCFHYVIALNDFLIEEVNGYYTEEGCKGLAYLDKLNSVGIEDRCRPVITIYWNEMKKILPCAEDEFSASRGGVFTSLLSSLVLTLFLILIKYMFWVL